MSTAERLKKKKSSKPTKFFIFCLEAWLEYPVFWCLGLAGTEVRALWILISQMWSRQSQAAPYLCNSLPPQHSLTPPNHCQAPDYQLLVPNKPLESPGSRQAIGILWPHLVGSSLMFSKMELRYEHLEKQAPLRPVSEILAPYSRVTLYLHPASLSVSSIHQRIWKQTLI